jgi:molybdopterin molybdotransferase
MKSETGLPKLLQPKTFTAVSVETARVLIIKAAPKPRPKPIRLEDADGRALLAAVAARRDQPPFTASAMDGYAISDKPEIIEALEAPLKVIGESQAGKAFNGMVSAGEAVRIFTGAPVPAGTSRVVIQENTSITPQGLIIHPDGWAEDKTQIRPQGLDFKSADVLIAPGLRLDAWRLSLAAAAGAAKLKVAKKPRVAILCTGDELVLPGSRPRPDQIYESTSHALIALVKAWGGKAYYAGVARDSLRTLISRIEALEADLIVTVGGASVGDHDLVRVALAHFGHQYEFERIDIRPGRPTAFGRLRDGRKVLSLPGNPSSGLVCAQLFLKPFIEKALGLATEPWLEVLPLAADLPANGPREAYLRARIVKDEQGLGALEAFEEQDSSLIQVFANACALIRRHGNAPALPAGHLVSYVPLNRL